jgi:CRISPR-associated endoribonuclease Cas6
MQIKITLSARNDKTIIPFNYAYPLSAAIYRILSKGDAAYAEFLHEAGYGKGFKFFSFSQLFCPFKKEGDRMLLLQPEARFHAAFHLPQAMENFVKGLFHSEQIVIADKQSRALFHIKSVESLPNPLQGFKENELVNMQLKPLSPVVAGLRTEDGKYKFLSPEQPEFVESLLFNWRSKIASCFDKAAADDALF